MICVNATQSPHDDACLERLDSLKEFYDEFSVKIYTGEATDEECEFLDKATNILQKEGWIPV